jgi:hypothetical protein
MRRPGVVGVCQLKFQRRQAKGLFFAACIRVKGPHAIPGIRRIELPTQPLLPGDRVRISAVREVGSARLLNGLLAEVVGPHPFARGWFKIRLDQNDITPHTDWSAPADRLKRYNDADGTTESGVHSTSEQRTVKHFP